MTTALWGWPVYSDDSVLYTPAFFAGIGSWSASLPLTNLKDRRLALVARSSSAAIADTKFQINLTTTRTVGLIAIPKHTISSVGTLRARGLNGNLFATSFQDFLDFSAGWSSVGTPTRVGANVTNSDGVPLDLIGDDSGAALEGYTRVLGNLGTTGETKIVALRVAAGGSSTTLVVRLRDTSASANRLLAVINPNAVPPTPTMTTGTHVSTTLVGTHYRVVMLTSAVTTANTNQLEIYPASDAALATATTGTANCGDIDVQGFTDDRLNYDSGYVTPWPSGLTAEDVVGLNVSAALVPTSTFSANLIAVDVRDSTNSAGYVDLARLIIAGRYQPTVNLMPGSGQGLEDLTTRSETDGGAALFTVRSKRRVVLGTLDEMQEAEMFTSFWKMQKQLGISGQFFFMWDSADTTYKHDRAFLAVFKTLDPITMAAWPRYRAPFQLVEEI